jgi:hypothetical protein
MIIERDHIALIPPNENDVIWRYLSLDKFISLLERKSLFFCRADRFSDPFEGSLPKKEADYRIISQENGFRFYGQPFNKEKADDNIKATAEMHKNLKRATVINCWHINEHESDGMWQLYLKSNEGVSIKSSVKRIINAFEKTSEGIYISKVRYIDYDKDIWYHETEYPNRSYNTITPFVHKRIEFNHETEMRLLYEIKDTENDAQFWLSQEFEKGIMISVDINTLIDKIVIPPTADIHIENKIKDLLKENKLEKAVIKSKLSSEPIY